jgi:hypothetical protein
MKIALLLIVFAFTCYAQEDSIHTFVFNGDTIKLTFSTAGSFGVILHSDSTICAERGHINRGGVRTTLAYCMPKIIDLPDKTIQIYHDTNIRTYICQRCGKTIKEPVQAKPDTTIIWIRK